MKYLPLILVFFYSLNLFALESADRIHGQVDYAFCGEMDPYEVGDACVVFVTEYETNKKFGLLYNDYDWAQKFLADSDGDEDALNGDSVFVKYCSKIYISNQIDVLKDHDPNYFYLDCHVDGFSLDIKPKKSSEKNKLMKSLIGKYNNLIDEERIKDNNDEKTILSLSAKDLPYQILLTLSQLNITVFQDGRQVVSGNDDSEHVVFNNENNQGQSDTFLVKDEDNQTVGYIFNISTCNIEECYGSDALYLDVNGDILSRSF